VPSLRDQWVAIDPQGLFGRILDAPIGLTLPSGAVVVDADEALDVLCQRLSAERRTCLTIVFAGQH
jgi:hypothetical protein